jgi:hypothetical protein
MGRSYEGEADLIKNNMSGDHDAISRKIKATIPFVLLVIADEDTSGRMRSKLMQGYREQVGGSRHTQRLEDARR